MHYSLTESEVITRKSQTETLTQFKALSTSKKLKNRQGKVNHCLAMALLLENHGKSLGKFLIWGEMLKIVFLYPLGFWFLVCKC